MQRNVKIGILEPVSRVYWEMKRARSRDLRRTETTFSQIDSDAVCANSYFNSLNGETGLIAFSLSLNFA